MVEGGMRLASVWYALYFSVVGLWLNGCKTMVDGLEPEESVPAAYQEAQADLDRRIASGELADVELIAEGEGVFVIRDFDREGAIFVIDTSGSMRDHSTYFMRRDVLERLAAFLFSLPNASQVAIIDAQGRTIAMWQASGMETKKGMPRSAIEATIDAVALYRPHSDSNWNAGLARAYALVAGNFDGLDTEIFILGDEYYREFWDEYAKLERVEAVPVSVVRAHEALLSPDPRIVGRSPILFERYGRYLAGLTGGHFYTFAPPEYRRDWKTVVLARLVAERPGEVWEMDLNPAERTTLNRLLGEQFGEERDFIVGDGAGASSEASRIQVSILEEKIRRGGVRCYIERSWIDGSMAEEFRATLIKVGSSWEIQDWERLWADKAK